MCCSCARAGCEWTFTAKDVRLASRTLDAGDVILLASGGHGFEVLDDCEMIEVKPGPYAEGEDKIRFVPMDAGVDEQR